MDVDGHGFSMHWLLLHIIQENAFKKQKMCRTSQQHEVLLHIFVKLKQYAQFLKELSIHMSTFIVIECDLHTYLFEFFFQIKVLIFVDYQYKLG